MTALPFHSFRRTGIGGSDAPAVLGLSPWKSQTALFLEKLGQMELQVESDAMRWGKLLEPLVRAEYIRRTGYHVEVPPPMRNAKHSFMIGHLDGQVSGRHRRVLEVKTSRTYDEWGEPGTDAVPTVYLIQCLHYLALSGEEMADLAVLIAGHDFRIYEIHRSPELEDLIINAEREFWERVQRQEPPEPKSLHDVNLRWRQSTDRAVELTGEAREAMDCLVGARHTAASVKTAIEEYEKTVKLALADADTGTVDGVIAVTWRQAKAAKVLDVDALELEHPEIVAAYQRERPGTRRFLVKG